MERWGHSCNVFQGKIYICAGRISLTNDSNELFEFDPATNVLREVSVSTANMPKPRRRHASTMLGHSLLIFGGYDGDYLKDFNFITLDENTTVPQITRAPATSTEVGISKINESNPANDLTLLIKKDNLVVGMMRSCRRQLENNEYFRNLLSYHKEAVLNIDLPHFSNLMAFSYLHRAAMGHQLHISKELDLVSLA